MFSSLRTATTVVAIVLFCLTAVIPGHAQPNEPSSAGAEASNATSSVAISPLIYDATTIDLARDLTRRLDWNFITIESLLGEPREPADAAWHAAVKAALVGGVTSVHDATAAIQSALEAKPTADRPAPTHVLRLLESADLLAALPEWARIAPLAKQALHSRLIQYSTAAIQNLDFPEAIDAHALRVYHALLASDTALLTDTLRGTEAQASLSEALHTSLNSEGILRHAPINQHLAVTQALLVALDALKQRNPVAYAQVENAARAMTATLAEMLFPDGEWPLSLQPVDSDPDRLAEIFERGYSLFEDERAITLLGRLYDKKPRSPAALLWGPPAVPSKNQVFPSTLLPQTGFAFLRSGVNQTELSVRFDSGASRRGGSASPLSIEIHRPKTPWTPRPDQPSPFQHNTVLVDGRPPAQPPQQAETPQNHLVTAVKFFPEEGGYLHATATGQYGEWPAYLAQDDFALATYSRTLFLMENWLIDLFRVRGGTVHQYLYHTPAPPTQIGGESQPPLTPEAQFTAQQEPWRRILPPGFQRFSNTGLTGFVVKHQGQHERIWFLNPGASEFILPPQDPNPGPGFVVNRYPGERNEGNLFAVLHQFGAGNAHDATIANLPLSPSPNERQFQAIAFAIQQPGQTDIFLSTTDPTVFYQTQYQETPLEFQARFGHIRLSEGRFRFMRTWGANYLRFGEHALRLEKPISSGVIANVTPGNDEIPVMLPNDLAQQTDLMRESLLQLDQTPGVMPYQPMLIQPLEEKYFEEPQPVRIVQPALPARQDSNLGPALTAGDSLLVENAALLERSDVLGQEIYKMVINTPIEAAIPAQPEMSQVHLTKSSTLQRFRGQRDGQRIIFAAHPNDASGGLLQFRQVK